METLFGCSGAPPTEDLALRLSLTTLSQRIALHRYSMVMVPSPLDEPLRALEATGYARSASTQDDPGSELHLAETQHATAHPALRRLKNALIGSANRKEELCRARSESLRLCVDSQVSVRLAGGG